MGTENADVSLRDELSASFDTLVSEDQSRSPAEAPAQREAPAEVSTAQAPAKPTDTPVGTPAANDKPAEVTEAAPAPDAVPSRLKEKWEAKWATLDPETKAEFRAYEANIGRLADKFGKAAKNWEFTSQVMAPYMPMIQREGGDAIGVIGSMLETARIMREGTPDQKLGIVNFFIRQYGIPAQQDAEGNVILGKMQTAPEVVNRLSTLEHQALTNGAERMQHAQQAVRQELDSFLDPVQHPYMWEPGFPDVMTGLMQAGQANNLSEAYEQAAWLHAGTRDKEIAKANQARVQPLMNNAARARSLAVSVPGRAPGTMKPNLANMSLRDTLSAAMDGDI